MNYSITRDEDYLAHHGVKGQKWGVRRYQNEDGSLTAQGQKQYGKMKSWQDSTYGRKMTERAQKHGMNATDAYRAHKASKAAAIGWLLAGPAGAIVGSYVSSKRSAQGRDFIDGVLSGKIKYEESKGT